MLRRTSTGSVNRGCMILALHAAPGDEQPSSPGGVLGEVMCSWCLGGGDSVNGGVAVRCGKPGAFSTLAPNALTSLLVAAPPPDTASPGGEGEKKAHDAQSTPEGKEKANQDKDKDKDMMSDMRDSFSRGWASVSTMAEGAKETAAKLAEEAKRQGAIERELSRERRAAATAARDATDAAIKKSGGWELPSGLAAKWGAMTGLSPRSTEEAQDKAEADTRAGTPDAARAGTPDAAAAPQAAEAPDAARVEAAENRKARIEGLAAAADSVPAPTSTPTGVVASEKAGGGKQEAADGKSEGQGAATPPGKSLEYSMSGDVHSSGVLYATASVGRPTVAAGDASGSEGDGWPDAFCTFFTIAQIDEPEVSSEEEALETVLELDELDDEDDADLDEEEEEEAVATSATATEQPSPEPQPAPEPAVEAPAADDAPAAPIAEPDTQGPAAPDAEPASDDAAGRPKAKELMWGQMQQNEQAAATLLGIPPAPPGPSRTAVALAVAATEYARGSRAGWDAAMWDEGETPAVVDKHWAELTEAEVSAATTMGYTAEDWDAEEDEEEEESDEDDEDGEEEI